MDKKVFWCVSSIFNFQLTFLFQTQNDKLIPTKLELDSNNEFYNVLV